MTKEAIRSDSHRSATPVSHARVVRQAEHDYYDCMARFGCDSAEAHVAERVWRQMRRHRP